MKSFIAKAFTFIVALISLLITLAPIVARASQPASAPAQPAATPTPATAPANNITGTIDINYKSRTDVEDGGKTKKGVNDIYTLDLNVVGTLGFQGKIEYQPTILSSVLGRETQTSLLSYDLSMIVRNPANLAQTKAVGKLVGTVPINKKGVYEYGNGNLRAAVDATGKAAGFESKYQGLAAGKPPKNESTLGALKKNAITLQKKVSGKTVKITVKDYDEMRFTDLVIAAGPTKSHPEVRVSGQVLYDYERSAWYFYGVTMNYVGADGKAVTDKLSGNIKWVEDPQRLSNGLGEYQFDVRVNEPEVDAGEGAAFAAADSEADFFKTDSTLACLIGTMKYKDEIRQNPNAPADASAEDRILVASSHVVINLTGNSITPVQTAALAKLLLLVEVVPMNAE